MLPDIPFSEVPPQPDIIALTLKAHQRIMFFNYNTGSARQNHKTTAWMSTFLSEINHIPFKLFGEQGKHTE